MLPALCPPPLHILRAQNSSHSERLQVHVIVLVFYPKLIVLSRNPGPSGFLQNHEWNTKVVSTPIHLKFLHIFIQDTLEVASCPSSAVACSFSTHCFTYIQNKSVCACAKETPSLCLIMPPMFGIPIPGIFMLFIILGKWTKCKALQSAKDFTSGTRSVPSTRVRVHNHLSNPVVFMKSVCRLHILLHLYNIYT